MIRREGMCFVFVSGVVADRKELRTAPRQEYAGWIYRLDSTACSSSPLHVGFVLHCDEENDYCATHPTEQVCLLTKCSEDGFYSSFFVIDDELEKRASWGRGYSVLGSEDGSESLQPHTVVLSQTVADALGVVNGDEVTIKLKLEYGRSACDE